MKKLLTLSAICLLITAISFASFPVKKKTELQKTEKSISSDFNQENIYDLNELITEQSIGTKIITEQSNSPMELDEMIILLLLFFFLGGLAGHRWYAGKPVGQNILFILTAGGCGIWAIIDLIKIIKGEFME